ncbi:MAG TPA: CYTH and CHAD domain-containing protein [Methyloceanibacter sp.]|nr:CYTH and CHAD domain-containing protein [Methyloceanibacter sp.]
MVAARDSARQASEIELKLEFAPADLSRIAAHPALQATLAPSEERELLSIYFDTPDSVLHKAGVCLRVRESAGRYVQTIKAAKRDDLIERQEWERDVSGRTPALDAAKGTALEPLLTQKIREKLQPVFETRIRRTLYRIEHDDAEIEAAIDRGEISTATQACPVCELELELKRGEPKALFRLAQILAEDVPLRLEVKTKAERGYELLGDGRLKPERATQVSVTLEMTAGEAFRAIALSCLRQIIANEPAMCSGKAEALHQMRIGLRRLRAAVAVFADVVGDGELEKIKGELKWITQQLGPARDLDVFAADVLAPLKDRHPGDETIAAAHAEFEERRAAAYATAIDAIQSNRFRAAILDLAEWIETGAWTTDVDRAESRDRPATEHAREKLRRLRKRIRRKSADLRHLSVPERHRLRIRIKRLRYATEFFATAFPDAEAAKRRMESLGALKDWQDALGGLNDLATHRSLLTQQAGDAELGAHESVASGYFSTHQEQAETLLLKAEQAFARFADIKPFWKT